MNHMKEGKHNPISVLTWSINWWDGDRLRKVVGRPSSRYLYEKMLWANAMSDMLYSTLLRHGPRHLSKPSWKISLSHRATMLISNHESSVGRGDALPLHYRLALNHRGPNTPFPSASLKFRQFGPVYEAFAHDHIIDRSCWGKSDELNGDFKTTPVNRIKLL